jgi:hypothetical protein
LASTFFSLLEWAFFADWSRLTVSFGRCDILLLGFKSAASSYASSSVTSFMYFSDSSLKRTRSWEATASSSFFFWMSFYKFSIVKVSFLWEAVTLSKSNCNRRMSKVYFGLFYCMLLTYGADYALLNCRASYD